MHLVLHKTMTMKEKQFQAGVLIIPQEIYWAVF